MPLSKKRDKERKRLAKFQPKPDVFQPNHYLAHKRVCPTYDTPDYDIRLDKYLNPLLRGLTHLPNYPDGRYREPSEKP